MPRTHQDRRTRQQVSPSFITNNIPPGLHRPAFTTGFPAHRPRLPQRDPQACRSYSLLYSRNESGGETRIGPLTNREVFVTESELGRAALSLASFFVAKHFTPSPLQSHPPQWTLPRPACAMPPDLRAAPPRAMNRVTRAGRPDRPRASDPGPGHPRTGSWPPTRRW